MVVVVDMNLRLLKFVNSVSRLEMLTDLLPNLATMRDSMPRAKALGNYSTHVEYLVVYRGRAVGHVAEPDSRRDRGRLHSPPGGAWRHLIHSSQLNNCTIKNITYKN